MTSQTSVSPVPRWQWAATGLAAVVILISIVHWGGTAAPGPAFAFGVGVLLLTLLTFAGLVYWLYVSPMPASQQVKVAARSPVFKQMLAVLLLIAGAMLVIGFAWDETWHRQYGVGGVIDDFWWRPHLLMYGSMGVMALFALAGMAVILRGRGSMRQRFRREPQIGVLALACGYLMVTAPVDPLWHRIYGLDITAWSLPHLSLAIGISVVMLAALAMQLSLLPSLPWRGLRGLGWREVIALGFLMILNLIVFQFTVIEWDGITVIGQGAPLGFWERPEWIYPVLIVAMSAFTGLLAAHSLRRAGVATLMGVGSLAVRLSLLGGLGSAELGMTAIPQLLALAPLLAIDVALALRLRHALAGRTLVLAALAAGAAVLLVGLPLIQRLMVYPRINGDTLPMMIAGVVLAALGFAWFGARLGGGLAQLPRPPLAGAEVHAGRRAALAGGLALLAAAAFVVFFVGTAQPPLV